MFYPLFSFFVFHRALVSTRVLFSFHIQSTVKYIYPTECTNYVNTILIYFNRKKKASLNSATLLLLICLYIGLPCNSSNVKVYSTTQQLYGINKWFDRFNKCYTLYATLILYCNVQTPKKKGGASWNQGLLKLIFRLNCDCWNQ